MAHKKKRNKKYKGNGGASAEKITKALYFKQLRNDDGFYTKQMLELFKDKVIGFYWDGVSEKLAHIVDKNTGETLKPTKIQAETMRELRFDWAVHFAVFTLNYKNEIAPVYDSGVMVPNSTHADIDKALKASEFGYTLDEYHEEMIRVYSDKGLKINGLGWIIDHTGSELTPEQQTRVYNALGAFNE